MRSAITLTSLLLASTAITTAIAPSGTARAEEVQNAAAAQLVAHGRVVISSSTYAGQPSTIAIGQALPNSNGAKATNDGTYPTVFFNDTVDGNFGITSPILLDGYSAYDYGGRIVLGRRVAHLDVTAATGIATSFASKSELALNLSDDGSSIVFVGYHSKINVLDVSNTNTPNHIDPTNTDTQTPTPRTIVQVSRYGSILTTDTNAYSGNNGRAAVLATNVNGTGQAAYFMAGNAGNGGSPPPTVIVQDSGVQTIVPGSSLGETTVVGMLQGVVGAATGYQYGYSVVANGYPADKSGKDDNFRGLRLFNQTLYVTKGSGGNGINTVYQITPPGGGLPTAQTAGQTTTTILPGFPTVLASKIPANNPFYPFGIYFANSNTLYVADEGPQGLGGSPNAGLQKWIFNGTTWTLAYTLQAGLNLTVPYTVPNYPTAYNPATTGLRNIGGYVEGNTVTIFAVTSTYSAGGDQGADPNQVVEIVDNLAATTLPANEAFFTVAAPTAGTVYRGVTYVP